MAHRAIYGVHGSFVVPARVVIVAIALAATPEAFAQPAPAMIRYSGSDGVELSYPVSWSRGRAAVRPGEGDVVMTLMLTRAGEKDEVIGRFGYSLVDLSAAPEAQRTAEFMARDTVALARKQNPAAVLRDVEKITLAGHDAWYFELDRSKDGPPTLARSWVVTWNEQTFQFVSHSASDVAPVVTAEVDRMLADLRFSPDYRKPDGTTIQFSDQNAGVRLSHPSHWHDETPPHGFTAQWGAFDADGERRSLVRVIGGRSREFRERFPKLLDDVAAKIHGTLKESTKWEKSELKIGDIVGTVRTCTGIMEDGTRRRVYLCGLQRDAGSAVMLVGTVLPELVEEFDAQWQRLLESVRLDESKPPR